MKFITALVLSAFAVLPAFAESKTKEIKCQAMQKRTLVEITSIKMIPPNTDESTEAEWTNQTVEVKWLDNFDPAQAIKQKDTVKMKYKKADERLGYLTGWFSLGGDFGDVILMMFHDYDENEVVVLADIATDGPIRKEVSRCKIK